MELGVREFICPMNSLTMCISCLRFFTFLKLLTIIRTKQLYTTMVSFMEGFLRDVKRICWQLWKKMCLKPAMQETRVQSLDQEDVLEKGMAIHSNILARIPWTEEPGGLQSIRLQRVGYNWVTNTFTHFQSLKLNKPTFYLNQIALICIYFFFIRLDFLFNDFSKIYVNNMKSNIST